ncbi:hypothetical protein CPB84DRAFT_1748203 [Gymnopilus junonius]|uniref:Uncharacterized protein n=1 Tax=Gymnopilus junonius TaxID=109634 RepID=A0A9P5NIR8_GYMJU|nr:hypothetical protein CPB84DRAFT_1748203 [Gymnopilus junonius]
MIDVDVSEDGLEVLRGSGWIEKVMEEVEMNQQSTLTALSVTLHLHMTWAREVNGDPSFVVPGSEGCPSLTTDNPQSEAFPIVTGVWIQAYSSHLVVIGHYLLVVVAGCVIDGGEDMVLFIGCTIIDSQIDTASDDDVKSNTKLEAGVHRKQVGAWVNIWME